MNNINDRKKAFEDKFAHDQELQFKVVARRNKLLGLWAGQQMGKDQSEREEYAKTVVMADFDEPGDDDVLRKVLGDLQAAGIATSSDAVRREMDRLLVDAKTQLMSEI